MLWLSAAMWLPAPALAEEALASNPAAIVPDAAAAGSGDPVGTVNGDNLIGRDVTSARDRVVGEIESVYVDAKGNVKQIIVTNAGGRTFAVDWSAVVVTENGKKIAVTAAPDQLSRMPEYRYARPEQQGTVFTDEQSSAAGSP
ncbi:MAG: PRC-barrel domain-containing protein [Sphingomonadales bacterium]